MAILNIGNTTARQKAPARWGVRGDGLDTLTVDYDVPASGLSTYIATLSKWAASSIDANMFLESWDNDDAKQYPTVTLKYIGFKGGTLPVAITSTSTAQQQATFTSFTGRTTLNMSYIAPASSKRIWATSAIDYSSIGAATAGAIVVIGYTFKSEGTEYSAPGSNAAALAYFYDIEVVTGGSEEVVPGAYYVGTQNRQRMLVSTQF